MTSHPPDSTDDPSRAAAAVVVCSRDRPKELEQALAAVATALADHDELVVVDSASRDRHAVSEVAHRAGATLVRSERPGLSRARNLGVAASDAALVAFTDDDCRPQVGWLDALVGGFDDTRVGVVAGRVVAEDAGGLTVTTMTDPRAQRLDGSSDPIDFIHGANMAFRREALVASGGFDELLGAGGRFRAGEDHDMAFRVLAAGWSGRYEPSAVVAHRQWRRRYEALRLEYGYGLGAGAFAAKIARLDGRSGRRLLRRRLWGNGLAEGARSALAGHEMAAASSILKAAGVVVGAAQAAFLDLDGQRFRDR